jgi:hypothetical protein
MDYADPKLASEFSHLAIFFEGRLDKVLMLLILWVISDN